MAVACLSVLVYDYAIMMDREVEYIWKSDWNWVKVVYLAQRYIPFIEMFLYFGSSTSSFLCLYPVDNRASDLPENQHRAICVVLANVSGG
jgi:hypothetical protein